jgi:hypothetical protein
MSVRTMRDMGSPAGGAQGLLTAPAAPAHCAATRFANPACPIRNPPHHA